MERTEAAVCLILLLSLWWKMREQMLDEYTEIERRLRRKRLLAARRERARKRRASELQRSEKRRQMMMMMVHHYYTNVMRTSEVWVHHRKSDWWEITAQRCTDDQWLEDFRVSRETFRYICTTLKPILQRQDTSFRL